MTTLAQLSSAALVSLTLALLAGVVPLRPCHARRPSAPSKLYTLAALGPLEGGAASSWRTGRLTARKLELDAERRDIGELAAKPTSGRSPGSNRWPARKRTPTSAKGAKVPAARRKQVAVAAAPPPPLELGAASANASAPKRAQPKRKHLVCYYGTWAVYRPEPGKFAVENIDPFLCTHIIYGFTGLSYDNQIKPLDPWNDLEDNYGKGAMRRFTNLKRKNPELKTLVAIGGWNEGSIKYSKMASEPEARARFVDSVVQFLAKHNFDGLDLDWEYPGSRGGSPQHDKQNFVRLLRELSAALKPRGYLLTAAVSAGKWFIEPAYDIGQVSKYLDLINLMAYDYHGGWESRTGLNAPLFSSSKHDKTQEDKQLNVNWSVNYWLAHGAEREKLLLGVGSYGRSFTLDRESENGIGAPAAHKGRAGPYTREPGSLGYNELCEFVAPSGEKGANSSAWTIVRDPDYLAPYAHTNNGERQWVGYDDRQSLALKAQFAKSMGLGGMMMWSIETDDFQGRCHAGEKFPLLGTLRRVLDGQAHETWTTTTTTTTTPAGSSATTAGRPSVVPATSSTRRPKPPSTTPGHEVEEEVGGSQRPALTSRRPQSSTTTGRPTTPTTTTTTTTTSRRPTSSRRPSSTSTTKRPPTSSAQPNRPHEFACRSDGLFADPRNCRKFFRCVGAGTPFAQRFSFDCGPGTAFSEPLQACDHVYNVASCAEQRQRAAPLVIAPAPLGAARRSHLTLMRHFDPAPAPAHFGALQRHNWLR